MNGWLEYTLALGVFFASHFVPRLSGLREALIARYGRRLYFAVYGVLSTGLLIWVFSAAGRAPYVEIWPHQAWMRWAPNLVMPLVFMLVLCGFGVRYPFTLGGKRGASFDPDDPGFAAVSRHPLFMALALWSGAHLLANGDLAHVILFGSFALMACAAVLAFDAKARRVLGPHRAGDVFSRTAVFSLRPFADARWRGENAGRLGVRALIALGLWGGALFTHDILNGDSPLPM